MINDMWKWLKGLFVKEEPSEEIPTTLEPLELKEINVSPDGTTTVKLAPKEKEVKMTPSTTNSPSLTEVSAAIRKKQGMSSADINVAPEVTFSISVPAGTMNRKMRRFLLSMGWANVNGEIMAPRKTTKELWAAINSLMVSNKYTKTEKRKLFKKSFGA